MTAIGRWAALFLVMFPVVSYANPDGPVRSVIVEGRYDAGRAIEAVESERLSAVGGVLSFPMSDYFTVRFGYSYRRYISGVESLTSGSIGNEVVTHSLRTSSAGWGMASVRFYLPLTLGASRFLRGEEMNQAFNSDGPIGSLIVEPRFTASGSADVNGEELGEVGVDVLLPFSRSTTLRF